MIIRFAIVASAVAIAAVLWEYGGESFLPGFVAGFVGSLLAFMLALAWERERELAAIRRDADELASRRDLEVRRRFESVALELEKNAESLHDLPGLLAPAPAGSFRVANPQLLDGAWTANAPRLSEIVSDYKLIGDLAVVHGRIEELRWRLRFRTEHQTTAIDGMTLPLIVELQGEVARLLERVEAQTMNPTIRPASIVHERAIGGTVIAD